MNEEKLQFIVDDEGNKTAVIIDIEIFYEMLDTLEDLQEHYYAHHPEERMKDKELEEEEDDDDWEEEDDWEAEEQ